MTQATKSQVLAQLERVCKQAHDALERRDMHNYERLSVIRAGLRVAVGHCNQNRDPGDIHIDDDILHGPSTECEPEIGEEVEDFEEIDDWKQG